CPLRLPARCRAETQRTRAFHLGRTSRQRERPNRSFRDSREHRSRFLRWAIACLRFVGKICRRSCLIILSIAFGPGRSQLKNLVALPIASLPSPTFRQGNGSSDFPG